MSKRHPDTEDLIKTISEMVARVGCKFIVDEQKVRAFDAGRKDRP